MVRRFWGECVELHHPSEYINDDAGFFNPAVLKPVYNHAPNLHGPSGGWSTKQVVPVYRPTQERVNTLSPWEICASTEKYKSGNAFRMPLRTSFNPKESARGLY
jgi:hypothetical protein